MNVPESRLISPPRNCPAFEKKDFSNKRKVWVVGDLHGCFKLLEKRLKAVGFRAKDDVLVSVGDLVNRGPHNELAEKWIPKMTRVIGNHEELTIRAHTYGVRTEDFYLHTQQGGKWFWELPEEKRISLAQCLWQAPVALEITTPEKNRIGVVHACVPNNDWDDMKHKLENPEHPEHHQTQLDALWDRNHIGAARRGADPAYTRVSGIDRVFFGHTPVPEILVEQNCVWIDTKAYATEQLMIIDIDAWIALNPLK